MTWLNYTTYTTYAPMGDSEERALIRQAMNRSHTASFSELARSIARSTKNACSKFAAFCHIAGKTLDQSRAYTSRTSPV